MVSALEKYFSLSTIHGVVYLSKDNKILVKVFWILSLLASIFCTTFLIVELVIKIKNFPIVIYLADEPVHISEVKIKFCRL